MQLLLAGIVVLGVLSHWLAWRLRLPSILFLLLIGLLVGPVTGVVRPDEIFGESLFPFVSLSVAIILFEGSLTLRWAELRGIGAAVWGLVTVGAAVTFALVTLFAHWLLGMPLALAALVGAICTVTGPTVVVPMLRAIRPVASVSKTLRWEGIVVDPIGAMLAILVVEFMRSRSLEALAVELGWLLGAGVGAGLIGGFGLAFLLRRHLIPWYLRNVVALAFVLAVFAVSNQIAHEAGLLAVTVMGVALANMRQINVDDILDFKESLTLLLVAVLFITLAARLDFAEFASMSLGLPVFLLAVIFVARPVAVFVSTAFSRLGLREKLLISWVSPRGIVAAAVASLFALELRDRGVDGAELLVPTIFSVIVGTVLLQSATAGRVAAWLRLSNPDPRGIIILGAGAANRAFARKLKERDYPVLFVDSVWEDVRRARMDGFETYYGRIVSSMPSGCSRPETMPTCSRCRPVAIRTRWRPCTCARGSAPMRSSRFRPTSSESVTCRPSRAACVWPICSARSSPTRTGSAWSGRGPSSGDSDSPRASVGTITASPFRASSCHCWGSIRRVACIRSPTMPIRSSSPAGRSSRCCRRRRSRQRPWRVTRPRRPPTSVSAGPGQVSFARIQPVDGGSEGGQWRSRGGSPPAGPAVTALGG
ncbi:MAG: sodium:proton antiporter [Burkholderiaceae bacterium]